MSIKKESDITSNILKANQRILKEDYMLQLQTNTLNLCRISKLIVKYNIKANITNDGIILDGDISEELLNELCDNIEINSIKNFEGNENNTTTLNCFKNVETEYDLIYSQVKRGEVYWADLGIPYGYEQGGLRPVIIVSDNHLNGCASHHTVLVIPCTTKVKDYPTHYIFEFSPENMVQYYPYLENTKTTCAMANKLRNIDKSRLRKFMGTMSPQFMEEIQNILDAALSLNRRK